MVIEISGALQVPHTSSHGSILMISFLHVFEMEYDIHWIHEGAALGHFSYFVMSSASDALDACLDIVQDFLIIYSNKEHLERFVR